MEIDRKDFNDCILEVSDKFDEENEIEIDMLVSWHGSERDKSYKEFLNFKLGIEGIIEQHDDFNTERK